MKRETLCGFSCLTSCSFTLSPGTIRLRSGTKNWLSALYRLPLLSIICIVHTERNIEWGCQERKSQGKEPGMSQVCQVNSHELVNVIYHFSCLCIDQLFLTPCISMIVMTPQVCFSALTKEIINQVCHNVKSAFWATSSFLCINDQLLLTPCASMITTAPSQKLISELTKEIYSKVVCWIPTNRVVLMHPRLPSRQDAWLLTPRPRVSQSAKNRIKTIVRINEEARWQQKHSSLALQ